MPILLTTIFAFVIVIVVLVFIHELGHFLAAKATGMRADIFSIGMGPRLFGWNRQTGFTFGKLPDNIDLGPDTDYRLCALPIGGYVRILGMIDESMDTEFAAEPPKPYEFRSKKNWQKAIVLSAGVIMNVLFAILLVAGLLFVNGTSIPRSTTIVWIDPGTPADRAGFEVGDSIMTIDGIPMTNWIEVKQALTSGKTGLRSVAVLRNGQEVKLDASADAFVSHLAATKTTGMENAINVIVDDVVPGAPASRVDIKKNDTITSVAGVPVMSVQQFRTLVRKNAGHPVEISLNRSGTLITRTVTVGIDSAVGIQMGGSLREPIEHKKYSVSEALAEGWTTTLNTFDVIWSTLSRVFRGIVKADQALGGPVTIAKQAANSFLAGPVEFMTFMALISLSLAFMNVLPLPGLDGGHLLIVAIESIIRRELPTNVKIRIQQVGIFLLLALMAGILFMELRKMYFS